MKLYELYEASRTGANISLAEIKNQKDLAKKLGLSVSKLTKLSDQEIQSILKNVGFHDFTPNSKFNKHQLEKGVKIEREHTSSDLVALLIAKDHLSEDPKYYDKLEKIEND